MGEVKLCKYCGQPIDDCGCNVSIHTFDGLKAELAGANARIERLGKALEVCKKQRNTYLEFYIRDHNNNEHYQEAIESEDRFIEEALEGKKGE